MFILKTELLHLIRTCWIAWQGNIPKSSQTSHKISRWFIISEVWLKMGSRTFNLEYWRSFKRD